MDIGSTILIIGFAALAAALIPLVIGLVYSELMNSDIPHGASNSGKLHMVQGLFVGMAIVVSISMIGTVLIVFLSSSPNKPIFQFTRTGVNAPNKSATVYHSLRKPLMYSDGSLWELGRIDVQLIYSRTKAFICSLTGKVCRILLNDCRSGTCHFLSVTVTEFSLDSRATLAAMLCQKLAGREGRHLSFPCTQPLIYPVPTDGRFQTALILVKSCCDHIVLCNRTPTELRPYYENCLSFSNIEPWKHCSPRRCYTSVTQRKLFRVTIFHLCQPLTTHSGQGFLL
uniref:Uncharacterized protein n=1 Tax=Xiphophorus couchianus TaxID=32473 RepID=A0A3B5M3F5_9TELE